MDKILVATMVVFNMRHQLKHYVEVKTMNIKEFRQHVEYKRSMEKIAGYSKGFKFSIPFYRMTAGQRAGMEIILADAIEKKLIDNITIDLSLTGDLTSKQYIKL